MSMQGDIAREGMYKALHAACERAVEEDETEDFIRGMKAARRLAYNRLDWPDPEIEAMEKAAQTS